MQKVWNVKKYDDNEIYEMVNKHNISKIMAKFLISRGIKDDDVEVFLNGNMSYIKDPFLIKDMDKFVERVSLAIENKEKICIYGDYDVDGITSITVMYKFLTNLGANVIYYLPDRLIEGYGVNNQALDYIKEQGTNLIITVDCGITANLEVEYAKSIGMDICITDHHECPETIPNATAVVNPKRKDDTSYFKMHAGVGVAFKCIMALSKKYNLSEDSYLRYLDIVAIGTISDIVPLLDENRIISKYGLKMIENTENVGLRALFNIVTFKEIDSMMVSFGMAPRINACGRMGKASLAVELLLENDSKRATELANELDKLNILRQQIEKEIFDKAIQMIQNNKLQDKNSIVLYSEDWHNGVIGIVASRLVNIYYRPVILLTKENGVVRGSGRCQAGFSLYSAITECKDLVIQFGGHELAAGLSIEEKNIPLFVDRFEEIVTNTRTTINEQIIDIDLEVFKEDLNVQIIRDIYTLKPYGQSNKQPIFVYKNLKIHSIRTLKDDKHLKLTLQDDRYLIEGIAFSQGDRRDELKLGDRIDLVCTIELNTFNTPKTLQLLIQDFKKSI